MPAAIPDRQPDVGHDFPGGNTIPIQVDPRPGDQKISEAITYAILLDFWGDVCTTFEEYPALAGPNQHRTIGRIYESYKKARKQMDPDFDPNQFPRVT